MRRRTLSNSAPRCGAMSCPSNTMRPAVGVSMRSTARPVVDLPEPLSPTRPSVSPRRMVKETPSTAFTLATWRWTMIPLVTGKCTFKSSTRRIGSVARVCGRASDIGKARLGMTVADLNKFRPRDAALICYGAAARAEGAADGKAGEVRRLGLDRHQPLAAAAVKPRDRGHEARGVGMFRAGEELTGGRDLDDAAAIHDGDAIGVAGYDAEIVGDQDQRGAGLARQLLQQVEDLRLHGDVERGGRLVRDDQPRRAG